MRTIFINVHIHMCLTVFTVYAIHTFIGRKGGGGGGGGGGGFQLPEVIHNNIQHNNEHTHWRQSSQ